MPTHSPPLYRGSRVLWVWTWTHESVTHIDAVASLKPVPMCATKSQATTFTTFTFTSCHTVTDTVAQAVEPGLYFFGSPLGLYSDATPWESDSIEPQEFRVYPGAAGTGRVRRGDELRLRGLSLVGDVLLTLRRMLMIHFST